MKHGVDVWNEWRRGNSALVPDLAQADLNSNFDELLDRLSAKIEIAEQRIEVRRERLREMYDE